MTAEALFEKGLGLLRADNSLAALSCFEKAYALKKFPELQSYLGMCIAVERGKITEAVFLCSEAMAQKPDDPVHYLNLGKVYVKAGRKSSAIETLRKGLSFGDNSEIRALLDRIGIRKKPVFSFLPRKHFLNRFTGLLLGRLKLR